MADPTLERLRDEACGHAAELLISLARLERQLRGDVASEQRETHAAWIARQSAGSGITHQPKENGRKAKATEQRMAHAT